MPLSPPFNLTFREGAHNAYWWDHSPVVEAYASGPSQHLLDDVYIDRLRALELDLHYAPDSSGNTYEVYHTERLGNSLCDKLSDCLKVLRAYQYGNPDHDPFVINFEIKNILPTTPFFTSTATPADLDSTLSYYLSPNPGAVAGAPRLPDWIFGPSDYYSWCAKKIAGGTASVPPGTPLDVDSLKNAVKDCGWPTVADLRGKFIFTMHAFWIGNASHVWDYTHGAGHGISQAKVFPMAEVTGDASKTTDCGSLKDPLHEPWGEQGVCDWSDHSVFAEVNEGVALYPGDLPYFAAHGYPSPLAAIQQFVNDGGITRYLGEQQTAPDVARPLASPPAGFPSTNEVVTDTPVSSLVNTDPARLGDPNPSGPLTWSSLCRFIPGTGRTVDGCTTPIFEDQAGIDMKVTGDQAPALGGTADHIAFLYTRRWPGTQRLMAFPSNRTDYKTDTPQATITPGWGCIMARQDSSADSPFFAVCRKGHGDYVPDGPYALWRSVPGGPTQQARLGDGTVPSVPGSVGGLGNAEIANYLELTHDNTGRCWSATARATSDPASSSFGPAWAPAPIKSWCFTAPLDLVGLAASGGSQPSERYIGETMFADATYGQSNERLTSRTLPYLAQIGTAGTTVDYRSYTADQTPPTTVDLTGKASCDPACTYYQPTPVLLSGQGTATHAIGHLVYWTTGAQATPVTIVPMDYAAGGAFARLTISAIGETDIYTSATDSAGNTEPVKEWKILIAPPTARVANHAYSTAGGATLTVDAAHGLLADASFPDSPDLWTIAQMQWPSHGTLILNNDGSFVYTPFAAWNGDDNFCYNLYTADGRYSNIAQVTIHTQSQPRPPAIRPGPGRTTAE